MSVLITVLWIICLISLVYVIAAGLGGFFRLVASLFRLSGYAEALHNSPHERQTSDDNLPLSLILPACDDDPAPAKTLKSLLAVNYPEYEVIAVCNGAKSGALMELVKAFDMLAVPQPIRLQVKSQQVRVVYRSAMYPNLIVLDKAGTTRADALNAGLNISRYPVVVSLPAGNTLEKDALEHIAAPFMRSHKVVALGGLPRVGSHKRLPRGPLGWLGQAAFLRAYPADFAIPENGRLRLIPGAYGAFRKQTVIDMGGFTPRCEETEMTARLHRKLTNAKKPHSIDLLPAPLSQNRAEKKATNIFAQQMQWQKALVSALWRNKSMTLNPKYGKAGTLDMPYYWFFDVLGPVLEILGCIIVPLGFAMGWIGAPFFWFFFAVEVLLGIVVSLASLMTQELIDSDHPSLTRLTRLVAAAILGNIGYRQVMLFCRVAGMLVPAEENA